MFSTVYFLTVCKSKSVGLESVVAHGIVFLEVDHLVDKFRELNPLDGLIKVVCLVPVGDLGPYLDKEL